MRWKMKIMKEPKDIKPKYTQEKKILTKCNKNNKKNHLFMNHMCGEKAIPIYIIILMAPTTKKTKQKQIQRTNCNLFLHKQTHTTTHPIRKFCIH